MMRIFYINFSVDPVHLDQNKNILAGLDVGSVEAKLVILCSREPDNTLRQAWPVMQRQGDYYILAKRAKILGDPVQAAAQLLSALQHLAEPVLLAVTGANGKMISEQWLIPYINEFKATSYGAVFLQPDTQTVLEIGGDGSRYLRVQAESGSHRPAILDYERNGDCAAGTGSFIDQQAARLRYAVEDIGALVLTAETTANIAGRCSVFAKSDMIHAQQRGYSPAAIFKGLCEAVVRNYKGTVLRGKTIKPPALFVGGVAANAGVVQAMRHILNFTEQELIVPELHAFVGALGCALMPDGVIWQPHKLAQHTKHRPVPESARTRGLSCELVDFAQAPSRDFQASGPIPAYLGIDVGSVSTNLALIDQEGWVLDEIYTRTDGRPVEVVQRELAVWQEKWGNRVDVLAVGTTGSGRELIGALVGADTINDEITAHQTGAAFIAQRLFNEQVDTIFEIGGQDSKFIAIENGIVVDFTMNEACAAGTGSFLEEQAIKMGISIIEEFAELALASAAPVQMGERCTVFMEKDVSAYLQQGMGKKDIAAGLAFSVVQNYLNRVVRDRRIGDVIYFQGGTAYNKAVAAAFAVTLQKRIVVPPHNGVMGAIGAALLSKEFMAAAATPKSRFYGFRLQVDFTIRHFYCKACSNQCDIQEVTVNGEKTYWGDKCSDRYRKKSRRTQKTTLPDLVTVYNDLLQRDRPGPDGLGIRIGFPKAMYYYDRFPFWRGYFSSLGAELVLSDTTNRSIVALGREHSISEPCFPIVAAQGHVVRLLQQADIDFVFVANAINGETEFPQTESWFCPWGQTLPLVLKNSLTEEPWRQRLLAPVVRFRDGQEMVEEALFSMAKPFGISRKRHRKAVEMAYAIQQEFRDEIKNIGRQVLQTLQEQKRPAVVLVGRAYNLYDPGLNINIPAKLRDQYGIDVLPMDYLPYEGLDVKPFHENMFWNYGRKILQTAAWVSKQTGLHLIYITNFKCGPDSYIKHFVRDAVAAPYLTLQFDEHSNDAGALTRCEAYLQSKGVLESANPECAILQETQRQLQLS
jgi:predicted CoA-substrate-specific enzyme activase